MVGNGWMIVVAAVAAVAVAGVAVVVQVDSIGSLGGGGRRLQAVAVVIVPEDGGGGGGTGGTSGGPRSVMERRAAHTTEAWPDEDMSASRKITMQASRKHPTSGFAVSCNFHRTVGSLPVLPQSFLRAALTPDPGCRKAVRIVVVQCIMLRPVAARPRPIGLAGSPTPWHS